MKYDWSLTKQFQDDLVKAYNKVAPTTWSQDDAYRKTVQSPAPRYYISPAQASQVLSRMVMGDFEKVELMMPNRKRLYYSLYDKVIELSEKRAFIGKSLSYIVKFAVLSPAPEFFVSYKTFKRIRCLMKRGHIDDNGKTDEFYAAKTREYHRKKREELEAYRAQFKKSTP